MTRTPTQRRRIALLATLAVGIAAVALFVTAGPAAGADYYNNSSGVVQPNTNATNATAETLLDQAVSLAPSVIGTGE